MRHLLVLLILAIVWQVDCSERFQQIGGKYYYIEHYDKLDWDDAREECRSMNAHLVSIQNYEEWDAITDHLKSCKSYWVDIIDKDSNYNYISDTTGREAPYLKWSSGQPRHRSGYDCVKLRSQCHDMKTKYCSQENHYICEMNTIPATTSPQIVHHPGAKYDIIDLINRK